MVAVVGPHVYTFRLPSYLSSQDSGLPVNQLQSQLSNPAEEAGNTSTQDDFSTSTFTSSARSALQQNLRQQITYEPYNNAQKVTGCSSFFDASSCLTKIMMIQRRLCRQVYEREGYPLHRAKQLSF